MEDQDPLICATMADSVRNHLQTFITKYRTNKARVDVEHYEKLAKQSKREYEYCVREYSAYCDANQDVMLQSFISKRDELENEMQLKFNAYSAMRTQLEAMRAKLQEKTPAFTTIESASSLYSVCASLPLSSRHCGLRVSSSLQKHNQK